MLPRPQAALPAPGTEVPARGLTLGARIRLHSAGRPRSAQPPHGEQRPAIRTAGPAGSSRQPFLVSFPSSQSGARAPSSGAHGAAGGRVHTEPGARAGWTGTRTASAAEPCGSRPHAPSRSHASPLASPGWSHGAFLGERIGFRGAGSQPHSSPFRVLLGGRYGTLTPPRVPLRPALPEACGDGGAVSGHLGGGRAGHCRGREHQAAPPPAPRGCGVGGPVMRGDIPDFRARSRCPRSLPFSRGRPAPSAQRLPR